jgi:predicted extracellular nuclease/subtilisin-like proprotein convertase family protein
MNVPSWSLRLLLPLAVVTAALHPSTTHAASFTPGNVVVYRVGDGAAALSSAAQPVFLDEYTPSGTLVQSIALPTAVNGSHKRLVASGTASSEGSLTRSVDGTCLVLAGYDTATGTASITGSTAATINRVVGVVDGDGDVDTTTALADAASGSNPRGAASTDCSAVWITGGAGGVRAATLAGTTSTQVSTTVTNLRAVSIFDGQLYVSTASGTAVRIGTVGTGTPTSSGQTITNIPGLSSSTGSPYGFAFFDLSGAVAGVDTLYVADDGAGALTKYSLVAGNWTSNGTIGVDADDYRGITGSASGGTVTLFLTRKGGSGSTGGGELATLADTSGYNGAFSGTPTLLATAATNTAFRGVALAPGTAPADDAPEITSTTPDGGDTDVAVDASIAVSFSEPVTFGGGSIDCTLSGSHSNGLVGGNPGTSYQIDPDLDFVTGETCTVTILATDVTDADGDDPPDNLASDHVFSFDTVGSPTDPTGVGAADPASVEPGEQTELTVAVTPGTNPTSSGVSVTINLSSLGGSTTQQMYDDGSSGGDTAVDGVYTWVATVDSGTVPGNKTLGFTVADAQVRSSSGSISLGVVPPLVTIPGIQGDGGTSPRLGQVVKVQGVVTAVRATSFFIQSAAGDEDPDPETSEGLLVFSAPTTLPGAAAIAVGDLVEVAGTVVEFIPSQDTSSPSITEMGTVTAKSVISSGHALPDPVVLTAEITLDADRGLDVLERFEGMRVSVDSMTVTGATLGGTLNETTNTQPSSGVFYAVVTGVPRPFREGGVAVPNPLPPGAPPNVPRFDGNPERLRVDSDAQTGAATIDANAGDLVTGTVGVLDYGFRTYTIYPDPSTATHVPVRTTYTPAPAPNASQITIAGFNVQRLFDTANDPATSDVAADAAAYASRIARFSQAIRLALHNPDVVAIQEAENLAVLQDLASRIALDGGAVYNAYLVEGNDIGGIDNGFLVKASLGAVSVAQQLDGETYLNPASGNQETLHDRPPLQLDIPLADGGILTVIGNHHRSLGDVESMEVSPTANLATVGERVRAKRKAQAESLATHVQGLQANPLRRIVLVGDFNAFEVSDGLVDVIGTILGKPAPADEVVASSPDLVNPDLVHLGLATLPADDSYSYNFDGNTQSLDHAIVSENIASWSPTMSHARLNSDFAAVERNDVSQPIRNSDHDPMLVYLTARSLVGAPSQATSVLVEAPPVTWPATAMAVVTVTASSGTPTGSVWLSVDGAPAVAAPLSGGVASFDLGRLGAGVHALVATYPAQPGYAAGTGVANLVVSKGTPEFSSVSAPRLAPGQPFALVSGLVAPEVGGSGLVSMTLEGTTQTSSIGLRGEFSTAFAIGSLAAGSYDVAISYPGDANWNPASTTTTVLVTGLDHAGSNPGSVTINDNLPASPFPSTISLSGVRGDVLDVWVSLEGLSHTYPGDLRALLVGPTGASTVLLDRVGGSTDVSGATLVFHDGGAPFAGSAALRSLTYAPSGVLEAGDFEAPAPTGPYGGSLAVYRGQDPNGTWSLYIQDDEAGDTGGLGLWTLHVLTTEGQLQWTIAGAGQFNGDGQTDLLWRNQADGSNAVWLMSGATVTGLASVTPVADTAWTIEGTGDFNLDGHTDIVWKNGPDIATWLMNGTSVSSLAWLPSVGDPAWQIGAVGDLSGDSRPDLAWRNALDGTNAVWNMVGTTVAGVAMLPSVADLDWRMVASGDFDMDGHFDLVWRNATTGANAIWKMNGASVASVSMLPSVPDLNWQIVAAARFDADAHVDIVWRNASTGANVIWRMDGTTPVGLMTLPSVDQ